MTEHQTQPQPSTEPRIATIVWGALLLLLGLAVIGIGVGLRVDLQAALIVILALAGVALLVKALTGREE